MNSLIRFCAGYKIKDFISATRAPGRSNRCTYIELDYLV